MPRTGFRVAFLTALAAVGLWLCLPAVSTAAVTGSPHDFSATGPFTTSLAPRGSCSFCHVPHKGDSYAIWARDLSGYRTNLVNDGVPASVPNYVLAPTIQCYDCHDYHGAGGINDIPALSGFNTSHRPQNIAFGFTKTGPGSMTPDPPGGTIPGYYENNPPAGSSTYGANPNLNPSDNVQLLTTGGHYFKHRDPTNVSADAFDIGDKIPCRDCHDPHEWSSNWQAFIRRVWPSGSVAGTRMSTWSGQASTRMANSPVSGIRSDANSRNICIACHGNSDSLGPVNFSDISTQYSGAAGTIVRPPTTVGEHADASAVECVSCHVHNSIDANCSQCHGFPPAPYPPLRNAAPPWGAYAEREPHPRHVGRGDGQPPGSSSIYSFDCKVCHATSVLGSRTVTGVHQDNAYNIAYDFSSLGVANPPDTTSAGRLTCGNVYCHSNGGSDNTAAVTGGYYTPAQWGVTAPLRCNGCHGAAKTGLTQTPDNTIQTGMPNYPSGAAGSATANSHTIHVIGNNYDCAVCHFSTAQGAFATGRTIKTSPLRHVNGIREVVFDGTTAIGTYDNTPATKTCHVSCHGAGNPRWGGILPNGCFECHTGTEQVYKPQNDYGTPGVPNPVDNNEYLYSGHGRSGSNYPVSGNLPAGFGNYTAAPAACYLCHSQGAAHTAKSVNDPFRLGHALDGTTGGMGTWTGAWADNTDTLCLGCHGTAAQRAGHDNAAKGTTTVDAQTHARSLMPSPAYSWPVTPWKCVDCHDPHGDGRSGAERIMMVRSGINAPNDNTDANAGSDPKSRPKRTTGLRAVSFTSIAGFGAGSYAQAGNGSGGVWGPCEVCHTQTTAYSRTKDNLSTHATRTTRCTTCHPHKAAFAPTACKGCHGPDSVAATAPDVGSFWASSGHGRFQAGAPLRPIECEDCHDTGFLTSADHKTAGVPGNPPHNINTLNWLGKAPLNADTNPNLNTSHLAAGYIDTAATSRAAIARKFDNQCATAAGCHSTDYHRHQKPGGTAPQDVMRFGDHGTKATPKSFDWYVWDTATPANYPNLFYQSRSPWIDGDVRAATGMSDQSVNYGLCISCHDPHGTGVTDSSSYPGLGTSNHMLRGNWLPPAGPLTFCNNAACHGP